jgi:hypothetical protein
MRHVHGPHPQAFRSLGGLNLPGTCLIGVVPTFVSWLMGGDLHRGAGQDMSGVWVTVSG